MINSTTIVGNLTRDAEIRYSEKGTAIANFSVAVQRSFKNQNGDREADFINVVQFGKGAELTSQYTSKGSKVGVTGRLQSRSFENKEGQRVYVTEVVAEQVAFLDSKPKEEKPQQEESQQPQGADMSDLDLPFDL